MLQFLFKYASKIAITLWGSALAAVFMGMVLENNFLKFVCIVLLINLGVFASIYIAFGGNDSEDKKDN